MKEVLTAVAAISGAYLINLGYDYYGLLLIMCTVIYAFLWINSPPGETW